MPCHTFSSARTGDGNNTGPRHLRSDDPQKVKQPLPNLTQKEKDKVKYTNKLYQAMICLIESCIRYKVPWYIENPRSSKLWLMPEVRKYIKHPDMTTACSACPTKKHHSCFLATIIFSLQEQCAANPTRRSAPGLGKFTKHWLANKRVRKGSEHHMQQNILLSFATIGRR